MIWGMVQKCPSLAPSCAQGFYGKKITKNAKKYDDISKLPLPFKKKIAVGFQDEKWVELLPKAERCWLPRGKVLHIPTLGYNKRVNCFITLFLLKKNIVWNTFSRRRNIEFRKHLSKSRSLQKGVSSKEFFLLTMQHITKRQK